jgi:hypothetical protein
MGLVVERYQGYTRLDEVGRNGISVFGFDPGTTFDTLASPLVKEGRIAV